MKVLILGNELFSIDMQWGFQQAGHDATVIHASNAKQMEEALEQHDADLLITLGAPLELKHEAMKFLGNHRSRNLKHIHWDTDGISSTYYLSKLGDGIELDVIYNSKPDLVLTICPEMQDFIVKKGIACELMYYAYNPICHHPIIGLVNNGYNISLVGNSYSVIYPYHPEHYRFSSLEILIKPILENGYSIQLYGDKDYAPFIKKLLGVEILPKDYHGYLPYKRTCEIYNKSFVNLVTQNHQHTITKRTFEILGSGGFVLSSNNEELKKLFEPGKDLLVSSSPEETLEIVEHYKNHKDEWLNIRKNAALSIQNHTYKQRAEFIIEKYNELQAN